MKIVKDMERASLSMPTGISTRGIMKMVNHTGRVFISLRVVFL